MSDKKHKFNFTPKSLITKKNPKKAIINLHEETKRDLYQNDFRKIKSNQIQLKYNIKNNFLTDIVSNDNDNIISKDNSATQILNNYLEDFLQKKNNNNDNNNEKDFLYYEEKNQFEEQSIKSNENNNDNNETSNNSSELKFLILANEKENIDFIRTYIKLKGLKLDKNNSKLTSFNKYNKSCNNLKKNLKHKENINQKKLLIQNTSTNDFSNNDIKENIKNNLTDETNYIKKFPNKEEKIKKSNEKKNNKTINSQKSNHIKEISIKSKESDKSYIKRFNTKIKKEQSYEKKTYKKKSYDNKSYRKTSENKKINHKIYINKTKSFNKSPIRNNNIFRNKIFVKNSSNKNLKLCIIKNDNNEEKFKKNKKYIFQEKKLENEKSFKKNNDEIKVRNKEMKFNKSVKSKEKNRKKEDIKDYKKQNKKEIKKNFNIYSNFKRKNLRNFDSKKLKRVQNNIFSVINELDEEAKGDTLINNSNNIKNSQNKTKKENENNENKNIININEKNIYKQIIEIPKENNKINNNKVGFKNNNLSIISNETLSNEIGCIDKKLMTSFLSTSTFNNDLVNYKPTEKNSSNIMNSKFGINNNLNNITTTTFSIINNSSIHDNINNNINNRKQISNNKLSTSLINNISKNNEKLAGSISDIIHINAENEENTVFLIENNSKIINEIDSNEISDIIPLENKDISLDYKINVYDSKLKNDIKDNNEISKEKSSEDDEGESIIEHFDIINNQIQNESKEIQLSQIKNKDLTSDNNNISNSNINLSITNLSKLTNFADSNIKFGEMSRASSKLNIKTSDLKKNNTNMEVIKETEINCYNNTKNSETNKKEEINKKRIEHKKVKKYNTKNNNRDNCLDNEVSKYCEKSIENISIESEENDKKNESYFYIKNIEKNNNKFEDKNEIENKDKMEKEPKDSVRRDEPKDNYKNRNTTFNNFKSKQNIISKLSNNIFEEEDLNPTNKLVNTNKKDIVNCNIQKDIDQNINNNARTYSNENIKKISLKDNLNNNLLNDKQLLCSPSSIKFNNRIIEGCPNKNNIKIEFNNIKKIDKNLNNIIKKKNNTVNEIRSKTLKINVTKHLNNIQFINNPQKSSDFYFNYPPSSLTETKNENIIYYNNENLEKEKEANIHTLIDKKSIVDINNNDGDSKNLLEQRNFYLKNKQLLYNNIPPNSNNYIDNNDNLNNNHDEEIIKYYYQNNNSNNQPKIIYTISPISENTNLAYKVYIQ